MSSKGFKTWNIIDGMTNLSICFGDKIKRIDIRHKNADGIFLKDGISLTASEFKFCLRYVQNFELSPSFDTFYDIAIKKDDSGAVKIAKKSRSPVTTSLDFWKKVKPLAPALIFIISETLPEQTLLDLYIICRAMPEEEVIKREWIGFNLTDGWPNNSWLHKLGIFDPNAKMLRKFDSRALEEFSQMNQELFVSFVRLMYLYNKV